jgi:hypothetical protein
MPLPLGRGLRLWSQVLRRADPAQDFCSGCTSAGRHALDDPLMGLLGLRRNTMVSIPSFVFLLALEVPYETRKQSGVD